MAEVIPGQYPPRHRRNLVGMGFIVHYLPPKQPCAAEKKQKYYNCQHVPILLSCLHFLSATVIFSLPTTKNLPSFGLNVSHYLEQGLSLRSERIAILPAENI